MTGPTKIIVAVLVLVNAGLLAFSLGSNFVNDDEVRQLPAGIAHWQAGSFSLANDSPPLARMVATLPALRVNLNTLWYDLKTTDIVLDSSLRDREEEFGASFAAANPVYLDMVRAARMANLAWWLLGAFTICRWASDLHGNASAVLALTLWCTCPIVLAQEQLATGALAAAAACVAATYAFRHYLKCPSWKRSLAAGFLLGVAQLVDFMSLVLLVVWPLLTILFRFGPAARERSRNEAFDFAGQLALIVLIGMLVVNLGYGFQGSGASVSEFDFVSRALGADPQSGRAPAGGEPTGNRFRETWVGDLVVPVPADYLEGLDRRWHDVENARGHGSRGALPPARTRSPVSSMGAKVPIGISVMVLWSVVLLIVRHPSSARWPEEAALWVPVAAAFAMTTPTVGLLSPEAALILMAPFAMVIAGKLSYFLRSGHRLAGSIVVVLGVWAVGSGLATYPHPRAYLNEAVGGPDSFAARMRHGPFDGGQDMIRLGEWRRRHSNVRLEGMAIQNPLGPELTKLPFPLPFANPALVLTGDALFHARRIGPRPGFYALDPEHLESAAYSYFKDLVPLARVGASIFIYQIALADTDRLRHRMGLPAPEPTIADTSGSETGHLYRTFVDSQGEKTNYAVFVPAGYRAEKPYPLILHLHGWGDRGPTGRKYTDVGVPAICKTFEGGFRFFIVSPQGRSGHWEIGGDDARRAMELLDAIEKQYRVDPTRIYLTGISSGGRGVWDLAAGFPNRWAAIVPVASSADASHAPSIYKIPCWCFHNSHDAGSPVASPREMVAALRGAGGTPKYTEFLGCEHNCWDRAYSMADLYDWLLQQRRPSPEKTIDRTPTATAVALP